MRILPLLLLAIFASLSAGCLNVRTHSTIDPIYMTLDVNLKVQLQEELSSVFDEIDAASSTIEERR